MRRILLVLALSFLSLGNITAQDLHAECLCCREYLTGDLFGARSGLAERGVVADLQLTQFYQGVADGGLSQTSKYGGKFDYFFISCFIVQSIA